MCGVNASSLNKYCLAQAHGIGLSLTVAGYLSGLPSPKLLKHLKSWSVVGAQRAAQECAHASRRALCAQQDASVEENVMGRVILLINNRLHTTC